MMVMWLIPTCVFVLSAVYVLWVLPHLAKHAFSQTQRFLLWLPSLVIVAVPAFMCTIAATILSNSCQHASLMGYFPWQYLRFQCVVPILPSIKSLTMGRLCGELFFTGEKSFRKALSINAGSLFCFYLIFGAPKPLRKHERTAGKPSSLLG